MTHITPESRFHRIIRRLERCVLAADQDLSPSHKKLLQSEETPMGIYIGDSRADDILFTNRGVIFTEHQTGRARRIAYSELKSVAFPMPASDSIELTLHLLDSRSTEVRVVGRQGNFRDVFEVGRFFMRVVEDLHA